MIITIASGKGGTGKTTVATNLALSIGRAQLIDCDVEEPNANIFLGTALDPEEKIQTQIPTIDEDTCDFCGKCADFCAYNALAVVPTKVLVFESLCHSCGGCALVCPKDAISWNHRTIGKIQHGRKDDLEFYHGSLDVGETQAVPVIKALKEKIDDNLPVILDAPPGTSCPVIETLGRSDYCILVTEPTPFGLHDLKLAVDVVKHLLIPFGVIINRDGMGDGKVEEFCKTEDIPLLMKIPHSEEIAKLYSKGIPFTADSEEWKNKFKALFEQIKNEGES